MKTACCSYEIDNKNPPVFWNEFNGVVQCHNCGHVYDPKQYNAKPQDSVPAEPSPIRVNS